MFSRTQIKKGDTYNRLTFIKESSPYVYPNGKKLRKGKFICECGQTIEAIITCVTRGHSKSCGCFQREQLSKSRTTHGLSQGGDKILYRRWLCMHRRCYNEDGKCHPKHGGKGITVAKIWHGDRGLARFIEWAKGNGFQPKLELGRENNDKGYSPTNCKFVTVKNNSRNKSNTRMVTLPKSGITMSFIELYDRRPRPVSYHTAFVRYFTRGWSLKESLNVKRK